MCRVVPFFDTFDGAVNMSSDFIDGLRSVIKLSDAINYLRHACGKFKYIFHKIRIYSSIRFDIVNFRSEYIWSLSRSIAIYIFLLKNIFYRLVFIRRYLLKMLEENKAGI